MSMNLIPKFSTFGVFSVSFRYVKAGDKKTHFLPQFSVYLWPILPVGMLILGFLKR